MLFYIDYLDYTSSNTDKRSFAAHLLDFRFDLLIFGKDTFCLSTPACIKLKETADILSQLDDYWINRKILLQLDKKHRKNAKNYFYSRTKKLEKSMPEEELLKHFEFQAYSDQRTSKFFDIYLPQKVNIAPSKIFIKKERDTDELFRTNAVNIINKNADRMCSKLSPNVSIQFGAMLNEISLLAADKGILFQRSIIENTIKEKYAPTPDLLIATSSILDQAFALANADTSYAKPLSLILNQLTGRWLALLLSNTYTNLYQEICGLEWNDLYSLSQNENWQGLISCVNALIFLTQDSHGNKYNSHLDGLIQKISNNINAYRFFKKLIADAVENLRKKAFEIGALSEAQNLEMMITLQQDCIRGNLRSLCDTLEAIDMYVTRVYDDLTRIKKYNYLSELGHKQRKKPYEILR